MRTHSGFLGKANYGKGRRNLRVMSVGERFGQGTAPLKFRIVTEFLRKSNYGRHSIFKT